MKELKEIQFDSDVILLNSNLVKGAILPKTISELDRDITIQGDTIVEGAMYAHKIDIKNGDVEIQGATFAQLEIHINSDAKGNITFNKSIGAVNSIVSHARGCRIMIKADVNASEIRLCNTFVSGSIFADDIILENSVVIGGVFATKNLSINKCVIGTFNSPSVSLDGIINILLPSVFSYEPIHKSPSSVLYNLSLADLGSLFRGEDETQNTGRIKLDLNSDEIKSTLSDEERQLSLRSYTVVGKVLAADMLDWDKLQNHFLLSAASLNNQLLKTYNFSSKKDGTIIKLSFNKIVDFFFDIAAGKVAISDINGTFSIEQIKENFG
jgi:hypothetical protein